MSINPLKPMDRIITIIKKEKVQKTDRDKKRRDKKQENNNESNRIDIKA